MQSCVQLPTSSYITYICTLTNILFTMQEYTVDTHLELFQCTLEWGDKVKVQLLWWDLLKSLSETIFSLHAVRVSFPVYMQPGSHSQSTCSQGLIHIPLFIQHTIITLGYFPEITYGNDTFTCGLSRELQVTAW